MFSRPRAGGTLPSTRFRKGSQYYGSRDNTDTTIIGSKGNDFYTLECVRARILHAAAHFVKAGKSAI